jgi:hypothetical protein
MRKMILFGGVVLCATVLLAATGLIPLKAKTGLWQMTEKVKWTGIPPELPPPIAAAMNDGRTINYKSCVKPKDLSTNPWSNGSRDNCHWTAVSSTGTDMEVKGTGCDMGKDYNMTANIDGKIHVLDPEHGTGTFDITLTGNGMTMHGHADYTGKWVAPSCPAGMN